MRTVTVQQVRNGGLTVVDVREYPEYAAGAIAGAQLVPLGEVEARAGAWPKHEPLVMVCKSGRRAAQAAEKLLGVGYERVAVMEGGMDAWRQKGLPVRVVERRPWSLERQVRFGAGGLVLGFSVLGLVVSPRFFAGAMFVGGGLVFAGVSDICLMSTVLGKMPWNRAGQAGYGARTDSATKAQEVSRKVLDGQG